MFVASQDKYFICDKTTGEAIYSTPEKMDAFTCAVFNNMVLDQYSEELMTFIYPHEYMDAKEDGSLPAELEAIPVKENDNPVVMKIKLKKR